MEYQGSIVALVTPMTCDGAVDLPGMRYLIEWQISEGTDGIVVLGTTGESPTLSNQEQIDIIKMAKKAIAGRCPLIVGTGTNATASTIEKTAQAKALGADCALVIAPYYSKPTQLGIVAHFDALHSAVDLPIMLYNHPGRTGVDMLPSTVIELSKFKNVIGIKDASGDLSRISILQEQIEKPFSLLSGDDANVMSLMSLGGHGVISVSANVIPSEMAQICLAVRQGDGKMAASLFSRTKRLHEVLGLESNPIPVKWALAQMGKIQPGIRLPLLPLSALYHGEIRQALQSLGVELCDESAVVS